MNESLTEKEIIKLMRLKCYEQPEEGFFDDFFVEFKRRQAEEQQEPSWFSRLKGRVVASFEGVRAVRWAAGAGLAYAAVMLSVQFFHSSALRVNTGEAVEVRRASSAQGNPFEASFVVENSTDLPQSHVPVGGEIAEYQVVDFAQGADFQRVPSRYF